MLKGIEGGSATIAMTTHARFYARVSVWCLHHFYRKHTKRSPLLSDAKKGSPLLSDATKTQSAVVRC